MPVFALFFPVPVAVASTAVVHLLNNLFKLGLLARAAAPRIVLVFGLPAVGAAFLGAFLLKALAGQEALFAWRLGERLVAVAPIQLTMGLLILLFAALELFPLSRKLELGTRWLPLGGMISGFFGGLSGHQGAMRAVFLRRVGLPPTAFAATQAAIASMVDVARLAVYGATFLGGGWGGHGGAAGAGGGRIDGSLVAFATGCAFAGSLIGRRLLPKTTIESLRWITGGLLLLVGAGLASGLLG
jgi:hypothetical protein